MGKPRDHFRPVSGDAEKHPSRDLKKTIRPAPLDFGREA